MARVVVQVGQHVDQVRAHAEQRAGQPPPTPAAAGGPGRASVTTAGSRPNATAYGSQDHARRLEPEVVRPAGRHADQVRQPGSAAPAPAKRHRGHHGGHGGRARPPPWRPAGGHGLVGAADRDGRGRRRASRCDQPIESWPAPNAAATRAAVPAPPHRPPRRAASRAASRRAPAPGGRQQQRGSPAPAGGRAVRHAAMVRRHDAGPAQPPGTASRALRRPVRRAARMLRR